MFLYNVKYEFFKVQIYCHDPAKSAVALFVPTVIPILRYLSLILPSHVQMSHLPDYNT